ncbi:MAG: response regulator [Patescibacteria group bacterium]|nr:response regulator [Patescibacteria group bacterium]
MDNEKKIKILLAEDDKFISKAYQDGLGRAGFEVIAAYDGNEALKEARKEKPDIILLDLVMPEKNGFEVLEEIKADNDLKDIQIIILSNLGQSSDIQRGRDLGANDYLIKSNFSIKEVIEKIKECV